jgi:hypothetical protein
MNLLSEEFRILIDVADDFPLMIQTGVVGK